LAAASIATARVSPRAGEGAVNLPASAAFRVACG